jgi:hypothetical protein
MTMTGTTAYRTGLALAGGSMLFMFFAMGALGIIGAEGDRADLMYLGVLAIGVVGALATRVRPRGMAVTLVAMAVATAVVGVIALAAGLGGTNPRLEIIGLTGMFMALFLGAAWLFRRAEDSEAHSDEHRV